jgi:recombination protein RecA
MPPSAAALRIQLESALAEKIPGALTPRIRQASELFPTGIACIDELLQGGIPRGGITEIFGDASTGKTTVALSLIAHVTRLGAACAWIDVHDALDPESAAACGVELDCLLWLRAGVSPALQEAPHTLTTPIPTPPVDSPAHRFVPGGSCGGCLHPRSEIRNMDSAVSHLFRGEPMRDKHLGTPGAPNRPLHQAIEPRCAEPQQHRRKQEQVASDRLPPRRGEAVLKRETIASTRTASIPASATNMRPARPAKPWSRLDQSLKAADLLLQAGGFSVIVLDLSNVLPEHALRVPLASWYRFRLAASHAQAAFVMLTPTPCARSCASLVLHCENTDEQSWANRRQTALFAGLTHRVSVECQRGEEGNAFRKKPSASTHTVWRARTRWAL